MIRKVRDTLRVAMSIESIDGLLGSFQEIMWPGGQRRPPSEPRSEAEKLDTRNRASQKLALLIPGEQKPDFNILLAHARCGRQYDWQRERS